MAEELRWEQLYNAETGAATTIDGAATFTNESNQTMHIRVITAGIRYTSNASGEIGIAEISKSPAQSNLNTNNDTFWRWVHEMGGYMAAAATAATEVTNDKILFAKGQLTLEPNESLYLNGQKITDNDLYQRYVIGYHY